MRKKVSLKDIADKVGVSITLVSYVLNNQKLDRISKAVALKINATAKELKYETNHVARSLKTRRTNTIGLIVADISNSFSSSLARIIEDEAEKFGYTVLFGSSDENAERSQKLMSVLLNHQVDGLIITPGENAEDQVKYLIENEIPFVLVDRYFPGIEASHIAIDNFTAAKNLTQHLINEGRRRIALINYTSNLNNLNERKRGYEVCLQENGIALNSDLIKMVDMDLRKNQVDDAMQALLSLPTPADAILFTSNTLSLLGLKYLNNLALKVPDDLAIVAFDESDAADLFYAPLTHIKQPLRQMGQLAVSTLMDAINNKGSLVKVDMQAEMIVRKSSVVQKIG